MKAKLFSGNGAAKGEMELAASVFEAPIQEHLLHQVITSYLANQRQGTAKTKGRSEVSGGGKKPWKQKGTGRARAGSNTSPVWVRGGKAFGPDPRDYTTTIPKKMRRSALRSALSSRAKDERILVVDTIACDVPKTKTLVNLLGALSVAGKKNLLILDKDQNNVYLSGRNIPWLRIRPFAEINALDVLGAENIIFGSEQAVNKLQEAVAP